MPHTLGTEVDVHIRGEVVMRKSVFEEKYRNISPNPRNLAAGALRQKKQMEKQKQAIWCFWHTMPNFRTNRTDIQIRKRPPMTHLTAEFSNG